MWSRKSLDIWDPGQHHPPCEREDLKGGGSNQVEMACAQELSSPRFTCVSGLSSTDTAAQPESVMGTEGQQGALVTHFPPSAVHALQGEF